MSSRLRRGPFGLALAGAFLLSIASAAAEDTWPQFRGPSGSGVSTQEGLPKRWSKDSNVVWSVEIPGRGWSSPIVWKDRLFVTSAISPGAFKEPSPGIYGNDYIAELRAQGLSPEEVMRRVRERDNELPEESKEVRWMVYCLDAESGKIIWQREAHRGLPFGGRHRKNTFASETPVTDGERVYAYFGNVGLFSYSMEGELLWKRRFEPRKIYLDFGTASSLAIQDGRVFVLNDTQQGGFIAALDASEGREVWRTKRPFDDPMMRSGFSTPFIWKNSGRTEVVALGPRILISYGLDGTELWRLTGNSAVAAPTPVSDGDMLYIGSGSPSENIRPLFAIRSGATGDISLTEGRESNKHVTWSRKRAGSYITSPIFYRDRLFVLYDKGFVAAFDAKSGREIYKARFGRGGTSFSSSPWAYAGKVFCLSEQGDTYVLDAEAAEYSLEATNPLDEMALATPAIANGSLYVRTYSRLYRIAEKD